MTDQSIAALRGAFSSVFAIAAALAVPTIASAATTTVSSGQTVTTAQTLSGSDTLTVQSGGAIVSSSDPVIAEKTAATGITITNAGTIQSTADAGRAINVSGSALPRTITLDNQAGGLIESGDDAFRVNLDVSSGTIIVNNAGTIQTTNGGQAIDFDAITTPGATVEINNLAGGVIKSYGADAVRPGQGAVVDNAGLIYSDDVAGSSSDGIDMQDHSGTVINEASGVISGQRHGITSSVDLDVTNYGSITGRNGSGVGSDGNGTVLNYGTITGTWDHVAANGDGDGVDIDYIANVTNYGTIQGTGAAGVDKGGQPNTSEGLAIGGGTVVNHTGATIYGLGNGILVDDGSGGAGYGATTITNDGTITGAQGYGIRFVGDYDDTIVNSGTISGGNGVAIDMGAGDDQLTLLPGSTITGTVDGGDGTDQVTLAGNGNGSFAGAVNFEHLDVASGNWTLTGASTFANGTSIDAGASLTGSAAVLTGTIDDEGTLTVDQPTNATFGATLTGSGLFDKTGAGTLTIGSQSFSGQTDVMAGTLLLTGTMPSAVTVERGATLAGAGKIAAATIRSGGTIAPGLGTLTVTGNFVQAAGSTYAATIQPGSASSIAVGGTATIGSGATLAVTRAAGTYQIGSRYELLSATGGISGTYSLSQTALGGTELRLIEVGDGLFAYVVRTGASLADVAINRNQSAVAAAFGLLDASNGAYAALTLDPDDASVQSGLSQLAGDVHASVHTAMAHDVMQVEDAAIARMDALPTHGVRLWGQFLGGYGEDDGHGGASDIRRTTYGGIGGLDVALGESVRAGVAGGYTQTRLTLNDVDSRAGISTGHVLGYVGGSAGAVQFDLGGGYSWSRITTTRTLDVSGYDDSDLGRYHGHVFHGFGQLGYALPLGGGSIEPFVGGSVLRIHTDGFAEDGGATALDGASQSKWVEFSDLGVKLATPISHNLSAHGSLAWQHAFGAIGSDAVLSFADGGGAAFSVLGAGLSRDSVVPTLDLTLQAAPDVRISVGYSGSIGSTGSQSTGRAMLSIGF